MRTRMMMTTLIAVAAALLTACTNTDDTSTSADFNAADIAFATEMIPHHRQATEMAALADSRTDNVAVLALADRIEASQTPEIDTMSGWLTSWGEDVPKESSGEMSSMPGMMSDDQLTDLQGSSGAAFDELFLTLMSQHHEGAIEMARTEQADGKFSDAVSLAATIEQDQAAELDQMKDLLGS